MYIKSIFKYELHCVIIPDIYIEKMYKKKQSIYAEYVAIVLASTGNLRRASPIYPRKP